MVIFIKDYLDEFKNYLYIFKKKLKKLIRKVKYYAKKFFSKDNKKNLVIGAVIFLAINLLILFNFTSFAYYQDVFSNSILQSVVGDFSNNADYTLSIYLETYNSSGSGSGSYTLTSTIPTTGYTYSGYKCKNNSILIYDDATNTTTVTLSKKDYCSIYFDLTASSDITVIIMLEDEPDSNNYTISQNIPYYGYTYSHYECTHNSILTYDSETHKVKVEVTTKDYCSLYFSKDSADIEVTLYLKNTSGKYIQSSTIPEGYTYSLDNENTSCVNKDGDTLTDVVTYTNGYIIITTDEAIYCDVYLEQVND